MNREESEFKEAAAELLADAAHEILATAYSVHGEPRRDMTRSQRLAQSKWLDHLGDMLYEADYEHIGREIGPILRSRIEGEIEEMKQQGNFNRIIRGTA